MNFDLSKRVVVVTGSGGGNGAAIAKGLARAGATVAVVDINEAAARDNAEEIRKEGGEAWAYGVDISDPNSCTDLASKVGNDIGPANVLVNNAGILLRGRFDGPEFVEQWQRTMGVNVNGTFFMTRAFLPALKTTRGAIVNVGSIQSFVGAPTSAAYATSKGAVAQLTRTLALELALDGIRVNAVAPGMFDTAMSAGSREDPARIEPFLRHVPMGRTARPEELVGPVIFLASDAASYVTGVVLPVDGGYLVV